MIDLIIVSYSNVVLPGKINLEKTLLRQGFNYKFVGEGEVWQSFRNKTNGLKNYLSENPNLLKNSIICLVDAYDVFACPNSSPRKVINGFLSFEKPIVFSAEMHCMKNCIKPTEYWKLNNINIDTPHKYLNSGFVIGYYDHILQLLIHNSTYSNEDDQIACGVFLEKYPEYCALDMSSILCGNIVHRTIFSQHFSLLDDGNVERKDTKTNPFFIHIPGDTTDFFLRTHHFGYGILKEEFVTTSVTTRFQKLKGKLNTYHIAAFLVLFLLSLYNINTLGIAITIGIVLAGYYYYCLTTS
jgi:hypothetical protein